jgi:hypothetical protein
MKIFSTPDVQKSLSKEIKDEEKKMIKGLQWNNNSSKHHNTRPPK